MAATRREILRRLLVGLLQVGGSAVVVLASASARAGEGPGDQDEKPLPEIDPNLPQQELQERVEQAATLGEANLPAEGDEDSWINGGFRNGGFRNGGFVNGGGFRNGGFANVPGPGGFRNSAFRNW